MVETGITRGVRRATPACRRSRNSEPKAARQSPAENPTPDPDPVE
jgi:hypothetical protein